VRFIEFFLRLLKGAQQLEYLLVPFSDAAFQRQTATPLRKISLPAAAILGLLIGVAGIGAGLTFALERTFLQIAGESAQAAIKGWDTYYVDKGGKSGRRVSVEWKKISYSFTTRDGAIISSALRREATDVRELQGLRTIEVFYLPQKPEIHLPRHSYGGAGDFVWFFLVGLVLTTHSVLVLKRYWRWWRTTTPPNAAPPARSQIARAGALTG
jgi:hypothetical protein